MPTSAPTRDAALSDALAQATARYAQRHPASRAQYERAQQVMPGGNTRSVLFYEPFPLAIRRGEGCRLWDADDHEYTDFLAEFTAGLYGHSHPVIRAAVLAALENGINLTGHNLLESELARLVCERFPSIAQVRFTNSGTEANLMALAVATAFTKRRRILVFRGAYHGGVLTFGAGHSPVNVPHDFLIGRYNDTEGALALIRENAADLAAVLVEPMQGSGGCIPAEPAFLAALRQATAEAGALLVFDEVMTSRLGPHGRQGQLGIAPDLTTLGKYIGGGMSFGAFGGRADIMALFDPRRPGALAHAGTFNNNVLTMAAGIAGLRDIYTPEAALTLNALGDSLRERLNAVCRAQGVALQFTGLGSLMNLHATASDIRNVGDLAGTDARVRDLFFFHMLEAGLYVARRGFTVLSLPITEADTGRYVAAFEDFARRHGALLAG
ncbi:aspartate aminotransferase family protein [Hydrogenophaga sp.]|uniref:aspartate aminotransferase family protein n=1 Tax=Hydrogenophaga sp. TaxID=1904254 RepID=UPI00260C309A|nr:aspartate aminotransferase family protein [Hydrogenophaga sp.]MCW5653078.1 aspartate aminotransferase family protein [Hydrogenophaga sp.]